MQGEIINAVVSEINIEVHILLEATEIHPEVSKEILGEDIIEEKIGDIMDITQISEELHTILMQQNQDAIHADAKGTSVDHVQIEIKMKGIIMEQIIQEIHNQIIVGIVIAQHIWPEIVRSAEDN